MAGAEGLEPPGSALEADRLPLTDAPNGTSNYILPQVPLQTFYRRPSQYEILRYKIKCLICVGDDWRRSVAFAKKYYARDDWNYS